MPVAARRPALLAAAIALPALLAACLGDDDPTGPRSPTTLLSPFEVGVLVLSDTIVRGTSGTIVVGLRNLTDTTIRVTSPDGCPIFEPVVRWENASSDLLVFANGGCAARTGSIDATRLDVSVGPRDTLTFSFPFSGAVLPTSNAPGTPQSFSCLPAGVFSVLVLAQVPGQPGTVAVARASERTGAIAEDFARLVEAPAGGPPACSWN